MATKAYKSPDKSQQQELVPAGAVTGLRRSQARAASSPANDQGRRLSAQTRALTQSLRLLWCAILLTCFTAIPALFLSTVHTRTNTLIRRENDLAEWQSLTCLLKTLKLGGIGPFLTPLGKAFPLGQWF